MHPQSIKASIPRPSGNTKSRKCDCCGIITKGYRPAPYYYCVDCKPTALLFGWIDADYVTGRKKAS